MAVDPLLLVILGPTASGKSGLAVDLAQLFRGEIVGCDSVALYRDFDVGTAKPTAAQMARVPHHLVGVVDPTISVTAGEYARWARQAITQIALRGHRPIVVGGTGLYLRALLDGLFPGPQRSEQVRQRLRALAERRGSSYLHQILRRLDPAAAALIHPHDRPKLIRAVEVCLASRRPMTDGWKVGREPLRGFRILRLGLNPERIALYERINQRAEKMFDLGLIEEARELVARYGENIWPLSSLGYRQSLQYLRGELGLTECLQSVRQGHRNYAKRQMTWFRREPEVSWLEGFGDDEKIRLMAKEIVEGRLGRLR